MKKNEVKRIERKSIRINLRITQEDSQFMEDEKLSPQKIFDKSLEELKNEK